MDKHTLQQWISGAEVRFVKSHKPFAGVPLVNRIPRLAGSSRESAYVEKIDLTRARNFCVQQTSEDILFASVTLPIFGKRGIGNDTGMAVASFDYTDALGEEHFIIAICAYTISGVGRKARELKKVITIPMQGSAGNSASDE